MRDEQVEEATMNALILYDEFYLATRAKGMLTRAMEKAHELTWWNVQPWRVNLLSPTGMPDVSPADAADAHLIVLAVRSQADLSPGLLDWLEQWAGRRLVSDAALAVFDGVRGDTLSTNVSTGLRRFAARHDLNLIIGERGQAEDESPAAAQNLHEREVFVTSTLRQIMNVPADYQRAGGINE